MQHLIQKTRKDKRGSASESVRQQKRTLYAPRLFINRSKRSIIHSLVLEKASARFQIAALASSDIFIRLIFTNTTLLSRNMNKLNTTTSDIFSNDVFDHCATCS